MFLPQLCLARTLNGFNTVCCVQDRSRQIFGGAKDFSPNFRKLARKIFERLCLQVFSHKNHEDLFLVWSPNKGFHVVSANVGCRFWNQTTLGPIFDQIFSDFAQIFRDFAHIFDKSKLLVCSCTLAFYTTIQDGHVQIFLNRTSGLLLWLRVTTTTYNAGKEIHNSGLVLTVTTKLLHIMLEQLQKARTSYLMEMRYFNVYRDKLRRQLL